MINYLIAFHSRYVLYVQVNLVTLEFSKKSNPFLTELIPLYLVEHALRVHHHHIVCIILPNWLRQFKVIIKYIRWRTIHNESTNISICCACFLNDTVVAGNTRKILYVPDTLRLWVLAVTVTQQVKE